MVSRVSTLGKMKRFIIALLSFLVLGGMVLGVKADNVLDWQRKKTITVHSSEQTKEYLDELQKLQQPCGTLVYDLYKLADVTKDGYGFQYDWKEKFQSLEGIYQDDTERNQKWSELAQEALKKAINVDTFVNEPEDAAYKGLELEQPHEIEQGMYLLVVRGSTDNKTVVQSKPIYSADSGNPVIEGYQLSTFTGLDLYTFSVQPIVICVPTRINSMGEIAPDTASDGDWIYDQEIALKMEEDPATGSILIDKELIGYNKDMENATFVFQVDTYYPTETELYRSEVYSMTFDRAGSKTLQVDGLPLNAYIRITEVYSGVNFEASIKAPDCINVVVGSEPSTVKFANTYNGNTAGGGGVTNHFTFDGKDDWSWEQKSDNTVTVNGILDPLTSVVMDGKKNGQTID